MPIEYQPHKKIALRDAGKDEKWLQSEIAKDPSILGLGELNLFRKEVKQSGGGRLDILLTDPEMDTMYEVEIMLGPTDPSHIIRTIEYWDVESRRYSSREHRAVIVAEEITNRFFNVIWLLSRSIPIIAIQLDAIVVGDSLLLHFTKVLDLYQTPDPAADQPATATDKKSWDDYAPKAMSTFDKLMALLAEKSVKPRLNYRQDGIALAGKWNFAKIVPRKTGICLLIFYGRLPESVLQEGRQMLETAGIAVNDKSNERFSVHLDAKSLTAGAPALLKLIRAGVALEG